MTPVDDLPDLESSDVDREDLEQAAEELGLGDVSSYEDRALLGLIATELGVLDEDEAVEDAAAEQEPVRSGPVARAHTIEAARPHRRVAELRSRPVHIRLGRAQLEFGGVALSVAGSDGRGLPQVRRAAMVVASRMGGAARRTVARLPRRSGT